MLLFARVTQTFTDAYILSGRFFQAYYLKGHRRKKAAVLKSISSTDELIEVGDALEPT